MSYKSFIDAARPEFDKAFRFLEQELAKVRTSRATPALVEDVEVNYMDMAYPLKQLAAISCPQPNQIVIQPWDASYIPAIEKAVAQSGLGMSTAVDKNLIRLSLPLLTEEYRRTLQKLLNEKAEDTRQAMRKFREGAWNKIQQAEKAKQLSQDEKFKAKDALQKLVDEYNEKIEQLLERKSREIA